MKTIAYIGTYTQQGRGKDHRPEGIYIFRMDPESGELALLSTVRDVENPSYLAISRSRKYLYATNEQWESNASAFAIDPATGALSFLNRQPTHGAHACYLTTDSSDRCLLVTNYSSGNLAVFPIQPDGSLAQSSDFIQHRGTGPNRQRQEGPHAHSIIFDPGEQFALAADLGIDKIMVYRLDAAAGKLTPHKPPFLNVHPGAGPRHMLFHPNSRFFYIANEVDNTVTACTWDGQKGILEAFQTVPTLPADFTGEDTVADIHLDAAGETLYVSNRGHDSLAVYKVDAGNGSLALAGHVATGGRWPRNFALAPNGKYLYAANEHTNSVVVFRLGTDGMPVATGHVLEVPSPVCIKFLEL
jgi:6-phosphogluconolactonase